MAFSELELKRIEQTVGEFCQKRSPAHLKDKVRLEYSVKGHEVVIVERRPRWDNRNEWTDSPVAKLKCIRSANKWRLYWQRADLKWHEYPGSSSSDRISDLVQEIDADHWPASLSKVTQQNKSCLMPGPDEIACVCGACCLWHENQERVFPDVNDHLKFPLVRSSEIPPSL